MTIVTAYSGVVAGEKHVIIEPKFRPQTPAPGIMFVHGAGSDAFYSVVPTGMQSTMTNTLVDGSGGLAISHDLGGTTTWGNATALSRMTSAYNHLQSLPGVAPGPVWLISGSMGCHTSLNWAAQNKTKVAGVISVIPVINPTDIVTNNRMGYAASVNSAYSGGWSEATYGAVYNPQTLATAGKLTGIPMLFFYGTTDALCVPAQTEAFAAKPGMNVTLVPIADGHEMSTYDKVDHPRALAFMLANQP